MTLLPGKNAQLKFVALLLSSALWAQVLPPGFNRPVAPPKPQQQQQQPPAPNPAKPTPAKPAPATPAAPTPAPGAAPQPAPAATQPPPAQSAPPVTPTGGLNLQNASLTEVIDILARQMKINYILDPRVKGGVTINTYGETKNIDGRTLLDMILRINGAAMVQVGDIYRIVPLADVQRLPGLKPELNGKPVDEDDRTMLNLLFLKYATVDELSKVLEHFLDPYGKMWSFPAANLLMIQDTRRNMRRLMDLVSLFDNDTFANQRVRLFEVKNGRPSDVVKELESILKSISLNEKASPVRLMPVDRINTVIAVAPNPGVFTEVEKWLRKLDTEPKILAGSIENFVYRVKYGRADMLAMAIMQLYGYPVMGMGMMGGYGGMGGMYGE
jgi:general secretion pathway protein D